MRPILVLLVLALSVLVGPAPSPAQVGVVNPGAVQGNLPAPFGSAPHPFNNSHPLEPWDPFNAAGRGQRIAEHTVLARTVVIPMEVPRPGSLPPEVAVVAVTLPGYRVTETTTGFIVHDHWGVEARSGVYYWTWRPTYFRSK